MVNAYLWTDEGKLPNYEAFGTWPGSPIPANADKAGWYDLVIGTAAPQAFNFIFNNGAATAIQTSDLWTDEDVCYEWESGKEKLIDCPGVSTDVEEVQPSQPALDLAQPMYNILGQKVDASYHGIIIQNGYKYIR